jgi:diaminohydroxyphosphoribosylaminopyrimidine deaminase/5-amino-6-(5-phosphoribosylamino)uracil reductase
VTQDEHFLRGAIRLAMNGRGHVEPNPMVACVIVKDGRVIGEGHTQPFGGAHAEPTALANCTESPEGATAYVTLEPCCHTNKKTPPCTPRLIEAKIARVVFGCLDPNPPVNGKGVAMLRAAGIRVDGPMLEGAAKQLIAPFLKWQAHRLPYVTLKWAESSDGKIAGPGGARLQISNAAATRLVHELRARSDVIMVGINTVLADDPLLTARGVENARPLLRYVLDRQLRIPLESKLVHTARETPLVVGTDVTALGSAKEEELRARGVGTHPVPFLARAMVDLQTRKVGASLATHVLVESGRTLAQAIFDEAIADRLWVICSPKAVGAPAAPSAVAVPSDFVRTGSLDLAGDTLTEYLNPASPVFFAAEQSADFVLARESAGQ